MEQVHRINCQHIVTNHLRLFTPTAHDKFYKENKFFSREYVAEVVTIQEQLKQLRKVMRSEVMPSHQDSYNPKQISLDSA